jgi:hypothetical protein
MTQIEILEQQIAELDEQSFARLREWFIEFDHARWDNKKDIYGFESEATRSMTASSDR